MNPCAPRPGVFMSLWLLHWQWAQQGESPATQGREKAEWQRHLKAGSLTSTHLDVETWEYFINQLKHIHLPQQWHHFCVCSETFCQYQLDLKAARSWTWKSLSLSVRWCCNPKFKISPCFLTAAAFKFCLPLAECFLKTTCRLVCQLTQLSQYQGNREHISTE